MFLNVALINVLFRTASNIDGKSMFLFTLTLAFLKPVVLISKKSVHVNMFWEPAMFIILWARSTNCSKNTLIRA